MAGRIAHSPRFVRIACRGSEVVLEGQSDWAAPDGTSWSWTGTALRVTTPRFGFCPLYVWQDGEAVSLSPSLAGLAELGLPLEPDYDALAVFLRLGFFIGALTPFRGIRQAAPGQNVDWPTDRIRDAFAIVHPSPSGMSRDAAIDGYGEVFRAAMRKLLPDGEIVLPLSGGRDSRHILFELIEARRKPLVVTIPRWAPDVDEDLPIARRLAERFGLEHRLLRGPMAKTRAQRRSMELTDFSSDELAWMLPLRRFLAGRDGTAFDGIAGDVLSNGLYLNPRLLRALEAGDTAEAADLLLGLEDLWQAVLEEPFYRSVSRERAAAALKAELAKHVGAPNPVSSYLFWNRTRREISLFGFKFLGDFRAPYLDPDVYDHLAALPASFFASKTFHTETIHRFFPQHSDIPFDGKRSSRFRRWRFRAESLGAIAHMQKARSQWLRSARPLLALRTKPAEIGRLLCLLELERFLRARPAAQPGLR